MKLNRNVFFSIIYDRVLVNFNTDDELKAENFLQDSIFQMKKEHCKTLTLYFEERKAKNTCK